MNLRMKKNDHRAKEKFVELWRQGGDPPELFEFLYLHQEISAEEIVEICVIDQVHRRQKGCRRPAEEYLDRISALQSNEFLQFKLVQTEFLSGGSPPQNSALDRFIARFPQFSSELRSLAQINEGQTNEFFAGEDSASVQPTAFDNRNGAGDQQDKPLSESPETIAAGSKTIQYKPETIGRYKVQSLLGDGGFGRVYLAYDDILSRKVAIKLPHRHRIAQMTDVQSYLKEARTVSFLEHHSILPVYDCGITEDGLWYIVSRYIEGADLATKVKRSPFTFVAAAELVATVAEALHHAHLKGVIHRDVKPANILIDLEGRPFLADFGIALREADFGTGYTMLGTVAYMSPEQLRGEGHLVDGRSDIYSLGIVFYELLTGRRPFLANRLDHATPIEPKSPRQLDDAIPKEIERVCLKALSHRVVDRYLTAFDFASDLRSYFQSSIAVHSIPVPATGLKQQPITGMSDLHAAETGIQIVPKGLRSFDRNDAGYFLELLPGPRNRDGIPESVGFWKDRILATESETFRVGVIYGPSGCGKSSFLKAGVIPQLPDQILSVYVESTPTETETRLLKLLRKSCPDLPTDLGLVESMTALRRRKQQSPPGRILIVLDQFEQWLHSRPKEDAGELVRALRQCDGIHLQCIITIRDDFWMAVTNFMHELEVRLVPENNLAAVDLFSIRHSKKVMTAIGRAYGILPPSPQEISSEHVSFISKAVAELATNDKVIPVQLALFTEMVKNKVWTIATLKAVGGTEGVGVTFLEEMFSGRLASPHCRMHQKAARSVLQALLSGGASGIKGTMRPFQELLEASGYAHKPEEFDNLLRILDSELRLITPTDPEGLDTVQLQAFAVSNNADRYYHLTHDYLVPSLEEWLTRKQKETRRGRIELLLADRAKVWNKQPSNRSLPSLMEWLSILVFARRHSRIQNPAILRRSCWYYGSRTLAGVVLLAFSITTIFHQVNYVRGSVLVESLASAKGQDVPKIIQSLAPYRAVVNPFLRHLIQSTETSDFVRLYAAMALFPVDASQEPLVLAGLLKAQPEDFAAICESLAMWGNREAICKQLWVDLRDARNDAPLRFRAGAALATLDSPQSANESQWHQVSNVLAERLVAEIGTNFGDFDHWAGALRPARSVLFSDLDRIFSKADAADLDRYAAAMILSAFAVDQPQQLVDFALRATQKEYPVFIPRLKALQDVGRNLLLAEYQATIPADASRETRFRLEKRKAHAAVALLEFDDLEPLSFVLSMKTSDPGICSYAEEWLDKPGTHVDAMCRLLDRAEPALFPPLLQCLANTPLEQLAPKQRESVTNLALRLFQDHSDGGIHSSAEIALCRWGLHDRLEGLISVLKSRDPIGGRGWYINKNGDVMMTFAGPIESRTGSPPDEVGRDPSDESDCVRLIKRNFAVSSKEVTVAQFLEFFPNYKHGNKTDYTPSSACPITTITWHRAAEYCVWLSEHEKIPKEQWCYFPDGHEMQPFPDYLTRTGYRLPTEAEWEYVCRAGTTTAYFWGDDPSVSRRYARTIQNSESVTWPVGSLCPNRFGFFDIHGNASEWMHDRYIEVPPSGDDVEDVVAVSENSKRTVRGGSFNESISYHRSANRLYAQARGGLHFRLGFRIARTISGEQSPK